MLLKQYNIDEYPVIDKYTIRKLQIISSKYTCTAIHSLTNTTLHSLPPLPPPPRTPHIRRRPPWEVDPYLIIHPF